MVKFKHLFLIPLITLTTLTLTACGAGNGKEATSLEGMFTAFDENIAEIQADPVELEQFQEISNIEISAIGEPTADAIGIHLNISSTSSNIELEDWERMLKALTSSIGDKDNKFIVDVPLNPTAKVGDIEKSTTEETIQKAPLTPKEVKIAFIQITGIRLGGSGEDIEICETSGFQSTKTECKDGEFNDPYQQQLDWDFVFDTYK